MILKSEGKKFQWSYIFCINYNIYWGVEYYFNCVQSNEVFFGGLINCFDIYNW